MPLIYTLISRQNTILTEYQIPDIGGNFPQITQTVLKRIAKSPVPPSNNSSNKTTADNIRERLLASTTSQSHHIDIENKTNENDDNDGEEDDNNTDTAAAAIKQSYIYDNYIYHYIYTPSNTLIYLVLTDREYNTATAYTYLEQIQQKFLNTFKPYDIAVSSAYQLHKFDSILESTVQSFNREYGISGDRKMTKINEQLSTVKDVMINNIDSVLERGEKIELLVDKSEMLNEESLRFKKSSKKLKYEKLLQAAKWYGMIALVILVVVYMLTAFGCGGLTLPNCR